MSTGAGIPTFRGKDGEWETDRKVRQAFEINRYLNDTELRQILWQWLADSPAWTAKPTRAHWSLKRLDEAGHLRSIMTQNFDMLEKRTGIRQGKIRQLHGRLDKSLCLSCRQYFDTVELIKKLNFIPPCQGRADENPAWFSSGGLRRCAKSDSGNDATAFGPYCPTCSGLIKPDIVFFGEPLDELMLKTIYGMDLPACDELWCIGSSLQVYPAADIPRKAKQLGKKVVIISTEATALDCLADQLIRLPADIAVSQLVEQTIANSPMVY